MLKDFKAFALKGNVVDLAVGVIIGTAFGKIVTSLVNDVLMPPLGLLVGNVDFSDLRVTLKPAEGVMKAVTLNYGLFLNQIIDFLIVAFCVFLIVRALSKLQRSEPAPPPAPTEKNCSQCCMTIPIQATRCGHCTATL